MSAGKARSLSLSGTPEIFTKFYGFIELTCPKKCLALSKDEGDEDDDLRQNV
jgi:hypothetical protein